MATCFNIAFKCFFKIVFVVLLFLYLTVECKRATVSTKYTHMDHNQLDPLPFKIIYTNIVDLWLHRHSIPCQHNIGVYDFKW